MLELYQLNGLSELCMNKHENDVFITAGGEITGADAGLMYMHLSKNRLETFKKKVCRKILKRKKFIKYSAKKLKIKTDFPWILDKKIYGSNIVTIYNTIGANSISSVQEDEASYIIDNFKDSNYISVRDKKSAELIAEVNPKLYPDSATCMSEVFSSQFLYEKSSVIINNFIERNKQKYVCIQMNRGYINKCGLDNTIEQLMKIIKDNYKVVLLPIGFAPLHEDNVALNTIYKKFKNNSNVFYFSDVNIYEIMNIIANSLFFAGTSLHGNITAMAFGIRHIGLNKNITKLEEYLRTWEIDGQNECIEMDKLNDKFHDVLKIDTEKLIKNKEKLIKLVNENFDNICNVILKGV